MPEAFVPANRQRLLALGLAVVMIGASGPAPLLAQDSSATPATESDHKAKHCIPTDRIIGYKVESDDLVRLEMKGHKDVLVHLKRACPQLHYHNYIAFQPINGELCARFDDIISRTGLPCRIESFTEMTRPKPEEDKPEESLP